MKLKKILAIIMAAMMLVSAVPFAAAAETDTVITEGSEEKADYKPLDDAIALLKELLETPELTQEYKTYLQEIIDFAEGTDRNLTQSEEDTSILLTAVFSALNAAQEVKDAIADGSALRADGSELEKAKAEAEELSKTEGLTDRAEEIIQAVIDVSDEFLADIESEKITKARQDVIDRVVKDAEKAVADVKEGIENGLALKAYYKPLDDAIALLKELLETPNLTEEYKTYIQEAIDFAEATDRNLTQSEEDTSVLLSAVFSALVAAQNVKDAIADGSALKADYTEADALVEEIEEYIGEKALSEELTKELEDLKAKLEELKADPETTQDQVYELIAELEILEEDAHAELESDSLYDWLWRLIKAVIEFLINLKW